MEKKCFTKLGRVAVLCLLHALAAVAVVGICIIANNAWISERGSHYSRDYMLAPWDIRDEYEDTIIFESVLNTSIQNILRMTVIRSQMETNGEFDGSRLVDVVNFANRKENDYLMDQELRYEYRLEDLIKWSNAGVDITNVTLPANITPREYAELRAGNNIYNESINFAVVQDDTVTELVEESILETNIAEEMEMVDRNILKERYIPAEGSLLYMVSSWEEYDKIVSCLSEAVSEVNSNYQEYKSFGTVYGEGFTNMSYYCEIQDGDSKIMLSNYDSASQEGKKYGRYLLYDPENMVFDTNTTLVEQQLSYYMSDYQYALGQGVKFWVGIDTSYPIHDVLYDGYMTYVSFMPYYWIFVACILIASLLYIGFFILLTVREGRERAYELKNFDKIPGEIAAFLLGAGILAGGFFIAILFEMYYVYNNTKEPFFYIGMACATIFLDAVILLFYCSLVRRLKAHAFWKTTLMGGILLWCLKKCRKIFNFCLYGIIRFYKFCKHGLIGLYNNSELVVRIGLPYAILMFVNFILHFHVIGIFVAVVLDIAVGMFLLKEGKTRQKIVAGIEKIKEGDLGYQLDVVDMYGDNKILAASVNSIGEGIRIAVEKSIRDEKMKADLITNVSHDIKTPLTSIINYVDLIKRENIEDEKIQGYIQILDAKSQRLKQLTDDLVEASKISSGNIEYLMEAIDFRELTYQSLGEFSERFSEKKLNVITKLPKDPVIILADSKRIWRIMENLFQNIYKYAMEGTRVYLTMEVLQSDQSAELSIKNISAQPLNIDSNELTERFIRGDLSRNTEGSGLGLSIAKNLTEAQGGEFSIYLDGDLFKLTITFPIKE